jgi:predicted RNase H-like nuclease (RuvC/YqgF family)
MKSVSINSTDSKNTAKNNELLDAQLREIITEQAEKIQSLEQQLNWFKRQIFGEKSEKRDMTDNPYQQTIADLLKELPDTPKSSDDEKQTVTYQRGKAKKNNLDGTPDDSGLRFDEQVPVEEIEQSASGLDGPDADD